MNDHHLASITVPGRVASVRPAAAFLVGMARGFGVPAADDHLFEVALVEALSNALKHNVRDSADRALHCEIEVAGRSLSVRVLDEAAAAPLALAVPTGAMRGPDPTPGSWETIPDAGYGLYLIGAVFSTIAPVTRGEHHGVELKLIF